MPQDVKCSKCSHTFPVTEARQAFTVVCPRCEAELTVEFKKPATVPEAGQPPYELHVTPGALPGTTVATSAKKRKSDDDDEEPIRKGGSAMIVLLSGGLGLMFVLSGLALTGWFLFTQIDYEETASSQSNSFWNRNNNNNNRNNSNNNNNNNRNNNNNNGGNNNGGNSFTPQKPKDVFELRPVTGQVPQITPPTLPADPSNLELEDKVGQLAIGGGGRYIVMHFPDRGKLGIFDVSTARLNTVQADTGDVRLAAGLTRAVVYVRSSNIMRVYSLPSLQKMYDATSPTQGLNWIAMGSRTDGPMLAIGTFGDPVLIDVQNNSLAAIEGSNPGGLNLHWNMIRASPDGMAFSNFDGWSPHQKTNILTVQNRKWSVRKDVAEVPFFGTDGNLYGNGIVMNQKGQDQRVGGIGRGSGTWYVPAVSGNGYFLKISPITVGARPREKKTIAVSIHNNRNAETTAPGTASFSALPEFDELIDVWGKQPRVALDEHLILVPEAKLLIIMNAKRDHLVLRSMSKTTGD